MTQEMVPSDFSQYVVSTRRIADGGQIVVRFPNNYGASVVRHWFSYGNQEGNFELAVLCFSGPGAGDWSMCYTTPITEDVLGHLSIDDVRSVLLQIMQLEGRVYERENDEAYMPYDALEGADDDRR